MRLSHTSGRWVANPLRFNSTGSITAYNMQSMKSVIAGQRGRRRRGKGRLGGHAGNAGSIRGRSDERDPWMSPTADRDRRYWPRDQRHRSERGRGTQGSNVAQRHLLNREASLLNSSIPLRAGS
jgi:hypothetical protein